MEKREFVIAIHLKEAKVAHDLTMALRDFGVMAHFYPSLDELWIATDRERHDLVIVDPLVFNHHIAFEKHPKIVSGQLPLVFYISSTQNLNPLEKFLRKSYALGFIREGMPYSLQLQPFMSHIQRNRLEYSRKSTLEAKLEEYRDRTGNMIEKLEESKRFMGDHFLFYRLHEQIEDLLESKPFLTACLEVLGEELTLTEMGAYILSPQGDQLFSPMYKNRLYKGLPSLWLDSKDEKGISLVSLDQASEVVTNLMGTQIVELRIAGRFDAPAMVMYLKLMGDSEIHYPWKILENLLTASYRKELLKKTRAEVGTTWKPWKFLDLMQNPVMLQADGEYRVLEFDFSSMVQFINHRGIGFQWEKFRNDIEEELRSFLGKESVLIEWGVDKLYWIIPRERSGRLLSMSKEWSEHFALWKYFDQEDLYIPEGSKVRVDFYHHHKLDRSFTKTKAENSSGLDLDLDKDFDLTRKKVKYIPSRRFEIDQ